MNKRLIIKLLGRVWQISAVFMLLSLFVSLYYGGEDVLGFVLAISFTAALGTLMTLMKPKTNALFERDGFLLVALAWISISILGCLPFWFGGHIPRFIDALFESVSGFTTTGASILTDIEVLPRGILFWRSFTHWIGGMGVLVFILAVMPNSEGVNIFLMRAESPGPSTGKLVPKLDQTARILYIIYLSLTALCVLSLKIAGLPWYDSLVSAFGTAGTGGFSILNESIAGYGNLAVEIIITVFMLLFGINFTLYFMLLGRRVFALWRNSELKLYMGIILAAVAVITVNIYGMYRSVGQALRYSFFQVVSIITTTGYATADFDTWPSLAKTILLILMVIGASAGSTGGGMKVVRVLLVIKSVKRECNKLLHPRAFNLIKLDKKTVEEQIITSVLTFFTTYMLILALGIIIISTDGFDITTSISAVVACISNIGPGLGVVGPTGNYSQFSDLSKLVLSICMLIGRLEIFPILILAVTLKNIPANLLNKAQKRMKPVQED